MSKFSDIKLTYWTWPSLGIVLVEAAFGKGWTKVEVSEDE